MVVPGALIMKPCLAFLLRLLPCVAVALAALAPRAEAQTNCQYLLNLNFSSGTRTGMAATWNWTNDKWNVIPKATTVLEYWDTTPIVTANSFTNLVWADNTASTVTVAVTNLTADYSGNVGYYGYPDTMFDSLLGSNELLVDDPCVPIQIYANPKVVITGMPSNAYDIYIYGANEIDSSSIDEGYRVQVGTGTPTSWKRTSVLMNTNWTENYQYVKFTNLTVNTGENVIVSLQGGHSSGLHIIAGLQIIKAGGGPTNCPAPTISPAAGSYTSAINITITNSQTDASYYYKLNGSGWTLYTAPISGIVNATTVIAQARRHGNLDSVNVTNVYTFPDNDGDGLTDAYEGVIGTNPALADTDYDGRTDGQEVLTDFTNPLSKTSVTLVRLAYFKFNTNTFPGEAGQVPLVKTNLNNPASWDGKALLVNSNTPTNLKYKDVETDNSANINLQQGTVRFWFRPDWSGTNNGGSGPGHYARLIELGAYTNDATRGQWVIGCNPEGTQILFSTQGGGNETNHFTGTASFTSNLWRQVVVTYTGTNSYLYLDGESVTNGAGVTFYPSLTVRAADGLNIGSDRDGYVQAKGMFEELETFNHPLSAATIKADFDAVAGRDTDGDGVSDMVEHQNGTDHLTSNLPFFVLITQPRQGSLIP
jgi:hypothetical protein